MSFAKSLSNEQLINLTVETAHRVSCLSESNDLAELREELLARLTKRAVDVANAHEDGLALHNVLVAKFGGVA